MSAETQRWCRDNCANAAGGAACCGSPEPKTCAECGAVHPRGMRHGEYLRELYDTKAIARTDYQPPLRPNSTLRPRQCAGDIPGCSPCPLPVVGTITIDVPGEVGRPTYSLTVPLCEGHMRRPFIAMQSNAPLYITGAELAR